MRSAAIRVAAIRVWVSFAVAGCALLCATACSPSSPSASTPAASRYAGTSIDRALPPGVAYLPLVDQTGRRVTLGALEGKTIVLADFLTSCQEVCPLTSAAMQQVVQAVDRAGLTDQVVVLEATVDPARDTPRRLRAYQRLFGKTAGWDFLTGTPANLAALWRALGVAYHRTPEPKGQPLPRDWQTGRRLHYDVAHQDVVYVIDANGHVRWLAIGAPGGLTPPDLPTTMQSFLSDEGQQNLASPDPQSWSASDVTHALSEVLGVPVDVATPAPS